MKLRILKDRTYPLVAAAAILGWGLFLIGAGVSGSSGKLAVVNTDRITSSSAQVQKLLSDASVSANAVGEELKKKQEAYKKASDRYNSQLTITSDDENKKRREEIRKLNDEIEEITFRLNREVKTAQEKAVTPLKERIVKSISEIAKMDGVSVVLSSENTIYFDPQIDLTDQVIARIDAGK